MSPLDEIVFELGRTLPISRESVECWMRNPDLEVSGALMSLITEEKHYRRIKPPLDFDGFSRFALYYYGRCISENPDREWADSRTTAGWDFTKWFIALWEDQSISRHNFLQFKQWLEQLYRHGSDDVRRGMITAILEHLFQSQEVANYFADWQIDPILSSAYLEGMELANLQLRRASVDKQ